MTGETDAILIGAKVRPNRTHARTIGSRPYYLRRDYLRRVANKAIWQDAVQGGDSNERYDPATD